MGFNKIIAYWKVNNAKLTIKKELIVANVVSQ
jgi:hypothetical protein